MRISYCKVCGRKLIDWKFMFYGEAVCAVCIRWAEHHLDSFSGHE